MGISPKDYMGVMRMTFIETTKNRLDKIKAGGDFDEAFNYCVCLAEQIIELNRIGRNRDKAIESVLDEKQINAINKKLFANQMKPDEFYEEEKAFYDHFADIEDI